MAIPGDFQWLNNHGENVKYFDDPTGFTKTAALSGKNLYFQSLNGTDMDLFLARRWKHFFGGSEKMAYQAFNASALTAAQKESLMKPGAYPVVTMSGGTVTVTMMTDGKFPNVVNYQGDKRSPAGVLGIPERNMFGGESVSITDPAI